MGRGVWLMSVSCSSETGGHCLYTAAATLGVTDLTNIFETLKQEPDLSQKEQHLAVP